MKEYNNLRRTEWMMPDGRVIVLWMYEDENGSTRAMNTEQYRKLKQSQR